MKYTDKNIKLNDKDKILTSNKILIIEQNDRNENNNNINIISSLNSIKSEFLDKYLKIELHENQKSKNFEEDPSNLNKIRLSNIKQSFNNIKLNNSSESFNNTTNKKFKSFHNITSSFNWYSTILNKLISSDSNSLKDLANEINEMLSNK